VNLRDWIAKRTSWREWGRRVTVDGVEYVRRDVAEKLFEERRNLVRKWKAEREKRRNLEERNRDAAAEARFYD
jgi:hypothetical protein